MTLLRQRVLTSTMIAVWLAIAPPLQASDTPVPEAQTKSPQTAPGGCSCDVRKQHQVKARLEKKKQQEQAGQVDPDQSSQSTETPSVNGSD